MRGVPFSVAAVEYQDAGAGFEPQHRREIMGLGGIERDHGAGPERRLDVKPGTAEIIAGHGGILAILGETRAGLGFTFVVK